MGKNPLSGKWPLVFNRKNGMDNSQRQIGCGQCKSCRFDKSRQWANRCMDESLMHEPHTNHFLTLTYNNDNIPYNHSLIPKHLTTFWKSLRKKGYKVKYYACGEYGDETARPHYHAIMYGLEIMDKTFHKASNGNNIYTSPHLTQIWGKGHIYIGGVTFESCAYVARYVMKKWKGRKNLETYRQYDRLNENTGEIHNIEPEFSRISKGIGKTFYNKFKSDIYQEGTDGTVISRGGKKSKPSSYYENMYELESEENFEQVITIKERRKDFHKERAHDNTPKRLKVKELIAEQTSKKQLPRKFQ